MDATQCDTKVLKGLGVSAQDVRLSGALPHPRSAAAMKEGGYPVKDLVGLMTVKEVLEGGYNFESVELAYPADAVAEFMSDGKENDHSSSSPRRSSVVLHHS